MSSPVVSDLDTSAVPFSFEEFSEWYESYRVQFAEPARKAAVRALNELLDRELREPARVRIHVRPGRIKSSRRAWQKIHANYADRVQR